MRLSKTLQDMAKDNSLNIESSMSCTTNDDRLILVSIICDVHEVDLLKNQGDMLPV